MRYGMLGEDPTGTEEKLAKYTGTVAWSYLRPHYEAGSLYFVDPGLELEVVGAAFAENRAEAVEGWLKAGDLVSVGSIGPLMPPKPGLTVTATYAGLPGDPSVSVAFE